MSEEQLDLTADVLVAGGGPAGAWAAIKAAAQGADVLLVDKGYCGTSGAAAAAGNNIWYVPPDRYARDEAMRNQERLRGGLTDRGWQTRVLDETWHAVNELAEVYRYPFPTAADGTPLRGNVQGPEYLRRLRIELQRAGVRVLDHSPLLELLVDRTGAVAGGAGWCRQDDRGYRVRSGAVVLATGGCAFLSHALGCDVDTGDGALLAVEVGAELSGMEFSNAYGMAPLGTGVTKGAFYQYATFYHADGRVLEGASSTRGRGVISHTLLRERVLCRLDQADVSVRAAMRLGQPNFFLTFDRLGIDPFTEKFPVTLICEGTVRGTGGIDIVDEDCATRVPGLYAAGDAATRELICGSFTGAGSHNAAWAMSSGSWAGRAAARYALAQGTFATRRTVEPTGTAGLRPTGGTGVTAREVVEAVQAEVFPYEKNLMRHGSRLTVALDALDTTWTGLSAGLLGTGRASVRAREAAALSANARWMYASALARTESRGMHQREDYPTEDPVQRRRQRCGGLDEVWVAPHLPRRLVQEGA